MAKFRAVRGNKAVHCVSKERLELLCEGMPSVELEMLRTSSFLVINVKVEDMF